MTAATAAANTCQNGSTRLSEVGTVMTTGLSSTLSAARLR
jgi:hypothetical protein